MSEAKHWPALVGRILLAQIFLVSGVEKLLHWQGTARYMASKGMPWVPVFLVGAVLLELLGGLALLTGYRARCGALALILFLVPTTLIFHAFWAVPPAEREMQTIHFMKNLAILGGLLVVLGLGPGPLALGRRPTTAGTERRTT